MLVGDILTVEGRRVIVYEIRLLEGRQDAYLVGFKGLYSEEYFTRYLPRQIVNQVKSNSLDLNS